MAEYYIAQIMMTGFTFPQKTFAQCNGQTMAIAQNQALFALLGVTYGGNGTTNFQLPDLRSRSPVGGGFGSSDPSWRPAPYPLGTKGGSETVTLNVSELPQHVHTFNATTIAGTVANPTGGIFAQAVVQGGGNPEPIYTTGGNLVPLAGGTVGSTGGGQPHPNVQPTAVINFNIALQGIWPSRN